MKPKEIVYKTALTAFIKLISALVAFFMILVITKNLDEDDSGFILLALSIIAVASVFFRLGLDNVILRKISSDFGDPSSKGALVTGILWILLACLPITMTASIYGDEIASLWFGHENFGDIFSIAIWAVPPIAVFMLISKAFQAVHKVILAVIFINLGISGLFIIFFYVIWFINSNLITPENCAMIYVLSAFLTLFASLFYWNKHCAGDWGKVQLFNKELLSAGANLWVVSISTLAVQWSSVLLAGAYIDAFEFAKLSAAQRTASLTSFVLMVVNMVVAPRFAAQWKKGDILEMKKLAKWSARGGIILATPIAMAMFFFADFIMSFFGENYTEGAILLSVFAIGQYINVATGSVGFLLTMSGHEKDYRRITLFVGPLTIILSYFMIIEFGALGAAIAASVGLSIQNIGALFIVKKRLGFMPFG
jgi:O-antigen/teichoic acid export membrane protein